MGQVNAYLISTHPISLEKEGASSIDETQICVDLAEAARKTLAYEKEPTFLTLFPSSTALELLHKYVECEGEKVKPIFKVIAPEVKRASASSEAEVLSETQTPWQAPQSKLRITAAYIFQKDNFEDNFDEYEASASGYNFEKKRSSRTGSDASSRSDSQMRRLAISATTQWNSFIRLLLSAGNFSKQMFWGGIDYARGGYHWVMRYIPIHPVTRAAQNMLRRAPTPAAVSNSLKRLVAQFKKKPAPEDEQPLCEENEEVSVATTVVVEEIVVKPAHSWRDSLLKPAAFLTTYFRNKHEPIASDCSSNLTSLDVSSEEDEVLLPEKASTSKLLH